MMITLPTTPDFEKMRCVSVKVDLVVLAATITLLLGSWPCHTSHVRRTFKHLLHGLIEPSGNDTRRTCSILEEDSKPTFVQGVGFCRQSRHSFLATAYNNNNNNNNNNNRSSFGMLMFSLSRRPDPFGWVGGWDVDFL